MKLTPRKAEVQHVLAEIDKDHPSADAAAKSAIKAVGEVLDLRDFYTLADVGLGPTFLWGVFSSEKDAEKGREKLMGTGAFSRLLVVPVMSPSRTLANIDQVPLPDDCECGHPATMHQTDGNSRGRCVLSATLYRQLGGPEPCPCTKFKKHAHPIPTHPTCVTCKQPVAA